MADTDLWILGLNCYDHDVAACLLRNGEIVVAINKERVTRIKHDVGFHQDAVVYCLDAAGITLDRVNLIVRNCYVLPVGEMERQLAHCTAPEYFGRRERRQIETSPLFLMDSPKVRDISHHLAHAYSAFAASPFDEGAVMIVDGVGSYRSDVTEPVPEADDTDPLAREAESYYRFEGTELETLRKVWIEPERGLLAEQFYGFAGLGALYSRVASYVFGHWNRCGEVMGLAPFGREGMKPLMWLEGERLVVPRWFEERKNPGVDLDDEAWRRSPHLQEWQDLAWRAQEDTERILVERARWLHERTGSRNLCIAGGVGLNCVANGKIIEETPFKNVYIQPASGDDGVAIGCALWGHVEEKKQPRAFVMRSPYLGREYCDDAVESSLSSRFVRLATRRRSVTNVARETARLLAAGKVIGWFQGRSEFGPRALGNRSILADPREAKTKDRVNERVKRRQGFRPFAPAVLAERAGEFFEGEEESPHMLLVKRVRPEMRGKVAAIEHVDGTARVQTVRREDNPLFYDLIEAFGELTGVPVLLNTSFNVRGQPIVETPDEAVETLLDCGLDALVIHDRIVEKRVQGGPLGAVLRFLGQVRRNLRSDALVEHLAKGVQKT
jgi:carbamoyltransferase